MNAKDVQKGHGVQLLVLQKNLPASIATLANTVQTVLVSMLNRFVKNAAKENS
jgi:hypothetical protein